jgi:hypothetical protein
MSLNSLLTAETMRAHRARWFVYAGGYGTPLTKIRHQSSMRGHWPGWDVECSCGKWESKTGGATKTSVADALWDHRYSAQAEAEMGDRAYQRGLADGEARARQIPGLLPETENPATGSDLYRSAFRLGFAKVRRERYLAQAVYCHTCGGERTEDNHGRGCAYYKGNQS